MQTGTYVALKLTPDSQKALEEYSYANGINVPVKILEEGYHVTVLYSVVPCHAIQVDPTKPYAATFDSFDMFTSGYTPQGEPDNCVLVVKLKAEDVTRRHEFFKTIYGATHSYPQYQPHVTISYTFKGDVNKLPPINFPINLIGEYTEDLNLDR